MFRQRTLVSTWKHIISSPTTMAGIVILLFVSTMAMIGTFLFPFDTHTIYLEKRLASPGWTHLLGCDLYGRDVLHALIAGAGTSLYIAFTTVLITTVTGIILGLVAGYYRGVADQAIMRVVDVLMAFPGILLTMAIASLSGPGLHTVILAISATGWTGMTRIVRAQVLSIREREFIHATQALGSKNWRIMVRHILPSILPPVVITGTFSLSGVILVEASLSFLGLGNTNGLPTWGSMLNQGRTVLTEAPHLSIAPGLMIMLLVLAFNFLGDALRDALDPRAES